MIHPGQWLLTSLNLAGDYAFWEKPIPTEKQARDLFNDLCRQAREHGGTYRLRGPDGTSVSYSAAAENE